MTEAGCRFEERDGGMLAVRGVLTFDTAKAAWQFLRARLGRGGIAVIDLSAVERGDSAGLACLLAVLAEAGRLGQSPRVEGLPAGLRRLAQVCEVEPMLASG